MAVDITTAWVALQSRGSRLRFIDTPAGRLSMIEDLRALEWIGDDEARVMITEPVAKSLGPAFEAGMAVVVDPAPLPPEPDPVPFWVHDPRGLG